MKVCLYMGVLLANLGATVLNECPLEWKQCSASGQIRLREISADSSVLHWFEGHSSPAPQANCHVEIFVRRQLWKSFHYAFTAEISALKSPQAQQRLAEEVEGIPFGSGSGCSGSAPKNLDQGQIKDSVLSSESTFLDGQICTVLTTDYYSAVLTNEDRDNSCVLMHLAAKIPSHRDTLCVAYGSKMHKGIYDLNSDCKILQH